MRRKVNIGFLGALRGLTDLFPAKNHISGHYITIYRLLKKSIFSNFWTIFVILADMIRGRDRPEMAGCVHNFEKYVLETL